MPIDPSIPLSVQGPQPVTMNSLIQLSQVAQQMHAQRQQQQIKNSLLTIFRDPSNLEANGMPNNNALRQISALDPELGMKFRTSQAEIQSQQSLGDERRASMYKTKAEAISNATEPALMAYDQAMANGMSPQQAQAMAQHTYSENLQGLKQSGLFSDQEANQMPSSFDANRVRAGAIKYKDWLTAQRQDVNQQLSEKRMENSERHQERMEAMSEARLGLAEKRLDREEQQDKAGADVAGSFDQGAIDEAADRYRQGNAIPSFGMSKQAAGLKAKIIQRAAEMDKEQGISSADAATRAAVGKADQQALGQLQKQANMVGAFEKTAMKNADIALAASEKADRTGIPYFNKWLLAGRKGTGSEEAANFDAANNSFAVEYGKVMSGSVSGQLTDSAREHANSIISTAQTPAQYRRVIQTLKAEMENRTSSFKEQRDQITQDMKGGEKILMYDPATGTIK